MVLTHSYWPEHSPPQRRWSSFIKRFTTDGWDVSVIAPVAHSKSIISGSTDAERGKGFRVQKGKFNERVRRVPYLRVPKNRVGQLFDQLYSAILTIPAAFLEPRPSAVVTTVPSLPIAVSGYVVARLRGVPLIIDMRDAWPDLARDARIVRSNAKSLVERVILGIQHRADLVITVTEGFAKVLRDRGVKKVITISNGVDLHRLPVLPPKSSDGKFRALYLGNHGASQNLHVIVRAASLVGPEMELVMVGSGIEKPRLVSLAKKLNAPVKFLDPVSGAARVAAVYSSADSCIISLRDDWKSFETTIPSKTYEVLAVGRHITAIVKGEAEHILRHIGAADVVTSDPSAIAKLWRELKDQPERTRIGQSGRAWVEVNADIERLAAELFGNVTELVEEFAQRGPS